MLGHGACGLADRRVGDPDRIEALRRSVASWRAIGRELGLSAETVKKMALARSKIPSTGFLAAVSESDSSDQRSHAAP
jgi:hypothetical protein